MFIFPWLLEKKYDSNYAFLCCRHNILSSLSEWRWKNNENVKHYLIFVIPSDTYLARDNISQTLFITLALFHCSIVIFTKILNTSISDILRWFYIVTSLVSKTSWEILRTLVLVYLTVNLLAFCIYTNVSEPNMTYMSIFVRCMFGCICVSVCWPYLHLYEWE